MRQGLKLFVLVFASGLRLWAEVNGRDVLFRIQKVVW